MAGMLFVGASPPMNPDHVARLLAVLGVILDGKCECCCDDRECRSK